MFSKKTTKIEKNLHQQFDTYLVNVKSKVKIWSIYVAFLENMNFKKHIFFVQLWGRGHETSIDITRFLEKLVFFLYFYLKDFALKSDTLDWLLYTKAINKF